ncbi:uncharacterized protein [Magallana gigas]|uniref:uncharacterized protein n=1 Tax=Magallana gigas TaxID=29159 RepID=UPI00333FC3C1
MKALYSFLFLIKSTGFADCCSIENINNVVENANVSCSDNLCTAQCYRGFILPTGLNEVSYYCTDGVWTPSLSSCKRLPVVSITYSAQWNFPGFLPSNCSNISARLDDLEKEIVDIVANGCQEIIGISASVQFNYTFIANTVIANFTAVYRNYTTRSILQICIGFVHLMIPNLRIFRTMFKDVTCTGLNLKDTFNIYMYVGGRLEYCLNGTVVHSVTTSASSKIEQYCDFKYNMTTIKTMIQGNTTSSTKTLTSDFSNMHQTVTQTTLDTSKGKTSIYILVPAAGVFLISGIVILVARCKKRAQAQEREKPYDTIITDGQTQYVNMTDNAHHYDVIGYTSERRQESHT